LYLLILNDGGADSPEVVVEPFVADLGTHRLLFILQVVTLAMHFC